MKVLLAFFCVILISTCLTFSIENNNEEKRGRTRKRAMRLTYIGSKAKCNDNSCCGSKTSLQKQLRKSKLVKPTKKITAKSPKTSKKAKKSRKAKNSRKAKVAFVQPKKPFKKCVTVPVKPAICMGVQNSKKARKAKKTLKAKK